MKKYLFILIALLIIPVVSFASSIPNFPMAFYGNVTINGTKAPEGTIIKAYYGATLAGQSTVDSSGAYGYISSIAKKLLISEGAGLITFKFQSASILSGVESTGTTSMTYSGFEEGLLVSKDLAFTYTVPSSGGGGGGGSGSSSSSTAVNNKPVLTPVIVPVVSSIVIPGCDNRVTGFSITTGQSCAGNNVSNSTTKDLSLTTGPSTYNFGTAILKNGSKGDAVKELQRYLNNTLNLGLVLDGKLGPKTIAVIKQWQKNRGLVADGLIGPKTKAMMK